MSLILFKFSQLFNTSFKSLIAYVLFVQLWHKFLHFRLQFIYLFFNCLSLATSKLAVNLNWIACQRRHYYCFLFFFLHYFFQYILLCQLSILYCRKSEKRSIYYRCYLYFYCNLKLLYAIENYLIINCSKWTEERK